MDGGWREGEGLPVSRQGFNEEPLKFTMTEQHPCPLQKPPTSLRRHAVVSSHFTSSTSSSWFPSFCLSLSYNCLLSLLLPPSPISPRPPLWSGHGSCLYLTNRGGPIPLAPRHLKLVMWWDVWKAVCTCVVSKGHVCISAFFKRHSETLMQHSGTDSDSLSIIPRHWYYSVISAKWLRGQLYCCPPINPTLLCASSSPFFRSSSPFAFSSSSSLFTQPQAKRSSILHCGGLLSYSMTSCLERSIKAMCYQMECILFCIWFAFELGGSELQRAVLWMWYKQS